MRTLSFTALLALPTLGLAALPRGGSAGQAERVVPGDAAAEDTGQEVPWTPLFDGKTLKGWHPVNGSATYEVVDGTIVGTTTKGSPNSFLCTDRHYGDFELRFEVKLHDDELNSGVQVRSLSFPSFKDGRLHGPQVEISTNGNAGFVYDEGRRGWLSKEREDEAKRAAFRAGQWNRYRVLCEGERIRTWINDVPVADLHDGWSMNGMIGLQVHAVGGDPNWRVAWRDIEVRDLGGGWAELFDGESLAGWKVAENPSSARVEDSALVVGGPRAHVYYDGPVQAHSFKNFELRAKVWTEPKANSGIYFHTEYQDGGWPAKGYEVQVNNTQGDPRKTGGLYAVQDVLEAPARDREWFEMTVTVRGRRVQVAVDGEVTADYTEPEEPERPKGMEGRLLSRGTFALQCHDPGSVVRYKDIAVRVLPE